METRIDKPGKEKCDFTLPMVALFLDATKPTTTATARRTAKKYMFILNNNFARAILYISVCHRRTTAT